MKGSRADQEILAQFDSPFEELGRDACIAVEPALAEVRHKFVGGLRLTADRTGDCRMFTIALAEKAAELGVQFQYGQSIRSIAIENGRVAGVDTEMAGRITGDKYVCALGSYAPNLQAHRVEIAGLSGQRLFGDTSGRR
jgi:D-amino-acid dehydrogenase